MDLYDLPWDVLNIIFEYKEEMEAPERFQCFFNTVFAGLFYLTV